jgi:hypothetical protein
MAVSRARPDMSMRGIVSLLLDPDMDISAFYATIAAIHSAFACHLGKTC